MRCKLLCLAILTVLFSMSVFPALAQAPAPGAWYTGFTVRNMSFNQSTSVLILFYGPDGAIKTTWEKDELGPTSSVFLYSGNIPGLTEETSAAVFSDMPVAVVANLASDYPKTESAYVSMQDTETSISLFAPGIYKDYYGNSSALRVMNTSSDYSTCVRVRYYALGESEPIYTEYRTVNSKAAYTFVHEDLSALGSPFIGSAIIDSVSSQGTCAGGYANQYLAATTHITIDPGPIPGNPKPWRLHGIHNPIIEGHYLAYLPVLCNNYQGNKSAVTVMNMEYGGQWVRLNFSNYHYVDKYIPGHSTALWYIPNEGLPPQWHGSGIAACITGQGGVETTDCEIVATVNQINENDGNFASYNGFTSGGRISHLPIVTKNYQEMYGGYTTTITCQNMHGHQIAICLKLDGIDWTYQWAQPGASVTWYLGNMGQVPDGYNGSGYAYSYYGEDVICLGQQNGETPISDGDWLTTYNGISGEYP